MRVGLIGHGMGYQLARNFHELGALAVVDSLEDVRQAVRKRYPVSACWTVFKRCFSGRD